MRDVRTRDLEADLAVTANTSGTAAVPSDLLELKYAYTGSATVKRMNTATVDQVFDMYPDRESGDPEVVAVDGSNFIFGPVPSEGTVVYGKYYAKPSALSTSLYDLFTNNPDLFLFAALCEATPFIKGDARIGVWENKYREIVERVNTQDKAARFGGRLRVVQA